MTVEVFKRLLDKIDPEAYANLVEEFVLQCPGESIDDFLLMNTWTRYFILGFNWKRSQKGKEYWSGIHNNWIALLKKEGLI